MNDIGWLFVAFAVVWLALGAYLYSISLRQRNVERRLQDLDRAD